MQATTYFTLNCVACNFTYGATDGKSDRVELKVGDDVQLMYVVDNGVPTFLDWDLFKIATRKNNILEEAIVKRIFRYPPNEVIAKNLEKFNECAIVNCLKKITFDDMKEVLIDYLNFWYENYSIGIKHCDVEKVCKSLWKETSFLDTAPRDHIISMLQGYGKMRKI